MFSFRPFILLIALACAVPHAVLAQRVYWDPPGGRLGLGKTEQLNLIFEDCSPTDALRLPVVAGLTFDVPSQSQQTSIINFQMSSRVVLTYPVRATQKGNATIPAFDAMTNKGRIAVGEVHFEIGEAGVGPAGVSIGDIVSSQLRPARTSLWVGEVVDLEYLLTASTRYNVSLASEPEWKPAGLLLEPLSQPERAEATVGNERRQAVRYRTSGLFTGAGQFSLGPVHQVVNVQTGERAGMFFAQPRIEQFTVASNVPVVTVKPLPTPAPADFRAAVGSFELESTVVPRTARIGEPITWTLALAGSGNWTAGLALPEREVSSDFHVVQPKSRVEMDDNRLFQGRLTEDAVLVPTRAGTYSLGPVTFSSFDPTSGQYRTQTIPAVSVTIDPVTASMPTTQPAGNTGTQETTDSTTGLPGTTVATPPPPLPGDLATPAPLPGMPLPVGTDAGAPRSLPLTPLILLPLIAPSVLWFLLAMFRALKTDSAGDRKRALRDLRHLLRDLAARSTPPDTATLERWRTLTARLWSVRRATPTLDDLAAALSATRGAARPDDWVALWREAETAMFSGSGTLPGDWVARALAAALATRIPVGAPWWPGRSSHWIPSATTALALCALLLTPDRAGAAEARDAYNQGSFAEAREAWVGHLAQYPRDWAAHNNAGLASAQLNAWSEATAHWTTAFLLNPHDDSVRHNLRLALTRMDGIDPSIRRVVEGPWFDQPVSWLAPAEWQGLLTGGAIAVTLALLALVASCYLRRWRLPCRAIAQAMAGVGLFVALAAGLALWRLGPLAHPHAAMITKPAQLLSIPSDVGDKQESVPVAPGTVVIVDRSFLGWDRISGRGDTAGWIRRENLHRFYATPAAPPAES